jgi:hypothetical protein
MYQLQKVDGVQEAVQQQAFRLIARQAQVWRSRSIANSHSPHRTSEGIFQPMAALTTPTCRLPCAGKRQ